MAELSRASSASEKIRVSGLASLRYHEALLTGPALYKPSDNSRAQGPPLLMTSQYAEEHEVISIRSNLDKTNQPVREVIVHVQAPANTRTTVVYLGFPITILQHTVLDGTGAAIRTDLGAVYLDSGTGVVAPDFAPLISYMGAPNPLPYVKVSATCVITEFAGLAHDHRTGQTYDSRGKLLFYLVKAGERWVWTFRPIRVCGQQLERCCVSRDEDLMFVTYPITSIDWEIACYSLPALDLLWKSSALYMCPPTREQFRSITFVALRCSERGRLLVSILDHRDEDHIAMCTVVDLPRPALLKPGPDSMHAFCHIDATLLEPSYPMQDATHAIANNGDFLTTTAHHGHHNVGLVWFVADMKALNDRQPDKTKRFETVHANPKWTSTSKVHFIRETAYGVPLLGVYFADGKMVTRNEGITGGVIADLVPRNHAYDGDVFGMRFDEVFEVDQFQYDAPNPLHHFLAGPKLVSVASAIPNSPGKTVDSSPAIRLNLDGDVSQHAQPAKALVNMAGNNGVVATLVNADRVVLAGEMTAARVDPLLPTPNRVCSYCGQGGVRTLCGVCATVAYCNVEHMNLHYAQHVADCARAIEVFRRAEAKTPDTAASPM